MLHWALLWESVRSGAWWAFVPPTIMLTVVAFALFMLQSSLDELFNPRLRRGAPKARPAVAPVAPGAPPIPVSAPASTPTASAMSGPTAATDADVIRGVRQ
jgi:peptide/nickel transport system permease protein